ncbi:phosphoadenosine phosphosulfate reductase [Sulfitobacter sp. KE29]|uniref:phosphoadenosine phosphosulfate reductase n=1 Tax=Sulfitobacter TaxID=60136 RepID=UPI0007C26EE9|nr:MULTISPECIES: phosphoadenosine phosphosulfate reductase [Sulfitobacter]KZY49267.1 phosphoadenosine phosphosulfate reductase [Sulfitobacter sp. HI0054]MBO9437714.1 phosphoadenosine phosphosulfate reductase [Sulfitobacter sp. R18_2]MDF3417103.1 phosphoadenosine phosphosulfate reductase [Sulfitobacter sp. Ks38]MDF3424585.1 phosphoadenosine phosphosulfate reductase [Sulfitobacter sp. KE29]MDF3428165.1 phosphoadenosine phosphosulfate reductase [Sulfitobacter sp. S46]
MPRETPTIESSLADMPKRKWLRAIEAVAEEDGYFQSLGESHFSAFIERETTLLVTFETYQGMHALSDKAQPLGWDMVRNHDWSHLCLASDGDTWFRAEEVYAYFDRLIDDGFFDEFDQVLFYGAGPCAYAAAAYSVAAPGAAVVAIQPQATLNPRITEWDDRFADMRILDFTSRYGYAPDMLDAAERVFVLYDPRERLDAMHAALFTRANVTKLRMPFMGDALQTDLLEIDQLDPLLQAAAEGTLDAARFAALYRARRDYLPYLRNLSQAINTQGRELLLEALCANVSARMKAPRFARRLERIRARRKARVAEAATATG